MLLLTHGKYSNVNYCCLEHRGAGLVCKKLRDDESHETVKTTEDAACHHYAQKSGALCLL